MKSIRTVYRCDHKVTEHKTACRTMNLALAEYYADTQTYLFYFPKNIEVKKISRIWTEGNTGLTRFFEDWDFSFDKKEGLLTLNLNTEIQAATRSRTNSEINSSGIFVSGIFVYENYAEYNEQDCPRCLGHGWYCTVIDDDNKDISVENGGKLTQEAIKMLFTEDDGTYGCSLKSMFGKSYATSAAFTADLGAALMQAESRIKSMQAEYVAEGGTLPAEEKLYEICVLSMNYYRDLTMFEVVLGIQTMAQTTISLTVHI